MALRSPAAEPRRGGRFSAVGPSRDATDAAQSGRTQLAGADAPRLAHAATGTSSSWRGAAIFASCSSHILSQPSRIARDEEEAARRKGEEEREALAQLEARRQAEKAERQARMDAARRRTSLPATMPSSVGEAEDAAGAALRRRNSVAYERRASRPFCARGHRVA